MSLSRIPSHMHGAIITWITRAEPHPDLMGGFFREVLCNRLVHALGQDDDDNARAIREWALFLYNDMPSPAWGSYDKLIAWYASGGTSGVGVGRCASEEVSP